MPTITDRLDRTRNRIQELREEGLENLKNRAGDLRKKGEEFVATSRETVQQRRERLLRQGSEVLEQGRESALGLEATALEAARELVGRARELLGDRATFLDKADEGLAGALVAVRAAYAGGLPIDEFDSLSIARIKPQLADLQLEDLQVLRAYEAGHKNRKTLLALLDDRIEEASGPVVAEA